jgi:hypothetical protein
MARLVFGCGVTLAFPEELTVTEMQNTGRQYTLLTDPAACQKLTCAELFNELAADASAKSQCAEDAVRVLFWERTSKKWVESSGSIAMC